MPHPLWLLSTGHERRMKPRESPFQKWERSVLALPLDRNRAGHTTGIDSYIKPKGEQVMTECYHCSESYGSERFRDLIVPNDIWVQISPTGDEGGLLCPNCICAALEAKGITQCPAAFMSGPIHTVSPELMNTMRRVENIEEALARAQRGNE